MLLGQFYEEEAFVAFLFLPNQVLVRMSAKVGFVLGSPFFGSLLMLPYASNELQFPFFLVF